MSARTAPKINVSPDQYFSCTSCGKCCTASWRIRVAPNEAKRIRESQSYQSLERRGYQALPVVDSQHQLGRDSEGACLFLDSEGCSLHAESGLHSKPSVCQLYPFGFIDTPDGYFVSLSYSCPAVLAGKGEAMSAKLEELQSIVEESPYLQAQKTPPNSRVVLSEKLTVDWVHYLQLEKQILETLSSGEPLTGLLRTASALADYSRNPSSPIQLAFQNKTSLISEQAWNILPLFACSVISVLELHDPNSERANLSEALLGGGTAYSEQLQCKLPPFSLEPADNLVTRNIIKHYIRNSIFGKKLLQGPTVIARLLMLATSVSVLLYYLKIKTEASQSLHFSFEDLEWGFDLIETNILTHSSDLEELFLEYERALAAYAEVFEAA